MRLFLLGFFFFPLNLQVKYLDRIKAKYVGEEIQTYRFKNHYSLHKDSFKTYKFDFDEGLNIFHVIGLRYQTSRSVKFPINYYCLSSIGGMLFLGSSVEYNYQKQIYFEVGINDIWLINYLNNADTLDSGDFVSLALGWSKGF